ncbi:MAG: SpoIID/LytB domain-containing protein [Endomicrobium sp.]|jgi:stage II sporulation protein D|nr:SpoIID/LytB domain-containing protein [Endomicrobium sp.]
MTTIIKKLNDNTFKIQIKGLTKIFVLKKCVCVFIILLKFNLIAHSIITVKNTLKVCIAHKLSTCTIHNISNVIYIFDKFNNKIQSSNQYINVSYIDKNNIDIDGYILTLPVVIQPSSDGCIFVFNKAYRGHLLLQQSYLNSNCFDIINIICLEDYLKGVLPQEIYKHWSFEALKVQAIISRTYVIKNYNRHMNQGFDICATTHCQVYGGLSNEAEVCNQAIVETECQVLTYKGLLAQTVFHASCGGHTENPKYIWDSTNVPRYLKGVKCHYCSKSPYFSWTGKLEEKFIRNQLINNNFCNIGKIRQINIKGKTRHGTVKQLEIIHSQGKLNIHAYKFRLAISTWNIKSNMFKSIKKCRGKFCFNGKGWGHRVGLCQWGTKVMAEKGKTYKQILSYFYPKTKIDKIQYQN